VRRPEHHLNRDRTFCARKNGVGVGSEQKHLFRQLVSRSLRLDITWVTFLWPRDSTNDIISPFFRGHGHQSVHHQSKRQTCERWSRRFQRSGGPTWNQQRNATTKISVGGGGHGATVTFIVLMQIATVYVFRCRSAIAAGTEANFFYVSMSSQAAVERLNTRVSHGTSGCFPRDPSGLFPV